MNRGRLHSIYGLAGLALTAGLFVFIATPSLTMRDFEIREGELVPEGIDAPFTFEVMLPPDELEDLRAEIEHSVPLFLFYTDSVWPGLRADLYEDLVRLDLDSAVIQGVLRELGIMYDKGIMHLQQAGGLFDGRLAVMTRNTVDGIPAPLGNINIHGLAEVRTAFSSTLRGGGLGAEPAEALASTLRPNVLVDEDRREASIQQALESYSMVDTVFHAGEVIIPEGGVVNERSARYLEALRSSQEEGLSGRRARYSIGRLLLLSGILALAVLYVRDSMRPTWLDRDRVLLLCTSWSTAILVTGILSMLANRIYGASYATFVTFGALHTSVFTNRRHAAIFSFLFAVLTSAFHPHPFSNLILTTVTGSAVAFTGWDLRRRNAVAVSEAIASVSGLVALVTLRLLDVGISVTPPWIGILETILSPAAGAGAAYLLLPVFEKFGVSTVRSIEDVKRRDHPLLLDLSKWAMGTWQHSQQVADLASEAARAIGADPVLAEAGGLFHDIGKVNDPKHFIENLPPDTPNPHDFLHPLESASRLRAHVTEGVRLARKFRVPAPVIDMIEQHHGRTVMKAFYEKARKAFENSPDKSAGPPSQDDFRYSGPLPATREAAIIMLADSVESATKNLSGESPEVIEGIVREVIEDRDIDGQLDDCQLTRGNLNVIMRTFLQVLQGRFHERVKDYPHG